MDIENEQSGKKKWIFIIGGILVLIAIIVFLILRFGKDSTAAKQIGKVLPFGEVSENIPGTNIVEGTGEEINPNENASRAQNKPVFLQLAKGPVAGATTVTHDGKTYVRYVLRENGFIYEVDPETGVSKQLTNTTIPRIYEALFGNEGNTVILRYLMRDQLTRLDVIKTYLAHLELPLESASTTDMVGALRGDYLPGNISSLSISPDGKNLFYLLPIAEGISGTTVSLSSTPSPKEVFRNSFSEWLPQLLNDGTILLTTKASANVPGYTYLYDPKNKTLARVIREKIGLTTQGNQSGTLIAYSENLAGNSIFSLYNKKGFSEEEGGFLEHETLVPLTTLPEKCAWGTVHHLLYCGSFSRAGYTGIPDAWYQGLITFKDTFWAINTDTTEITLLANPQDTLKKDFDVTMPFVDNKETFLFFTDKNDSSLWSMRIEEKTQEENNLGEFTPEELKDVKGSTYSSTTLGN